jgi:hypothetical protein
MIRICATRIPPVDSKSDKFTSIELHWTHLPPPSGRFQGARTTFSEANERKNIPTTYTLKEIRSRKFGREELGIRRDAIKLNGFFSFSSGSNGLGKSHFLG